MSAITTPEIPTVPASPRGGPTLEIASLYPLQGFWTEADYFALDTNRLIELADGCLDVLPVPTLAHQWIAKYLADILEAHIAAIGRPKGVAMAPLPIPLFSGTVREPDVVYMRPDQIGDPRKARQGAELAIEVVSLGKENRERDLVTKREEYAKAGIREYWIVDPEFAQISVLTLVGNVYSVHGEFSRGSRATSLLFPGLEIGVDETLASGESDQV